MSSRTPNQRTRSAGNPRWRAMRIARSTATQDITREKVKCCCPPRVSQIPSSAWSQFSQTHSTIRARSLQAPWEIGVPYLLKR